MTKHTAFERNMFARDLAACLALSDARKAENAEARERMRANSELADALLTDAIRRGDVAIDWDSYFRTMGVA